MGKFGLYGKFTVEEGKRETLVDILLEAASSMEKLEDCDIYQVSISDEEPQSVFIYEVWANEQAHQASLSLEVTQTLIKRGKTIITGMERISTLEVMGQSDRVN